MLSASPAHPYINAVDVNEALFCFVHADKKGKKASLPACGRNRQDGVRAASKIAI
jgi:hypothetical protein